MLDTLKVSQGSIIDTVYIQKSIIDPATQHYIEILEKTNSQLSLWTNPYGIIVGALAVLFTVLGIVAVVLNFKQSSDFKKQLNDTMRGYEALINAFIEKSSKNLAVLMEDFQRGQKLK